MNKFLRTLVFCTLSIVGNSLYAQSIDSLSTQVIQVNTTYNPTVEEAFRISSDPNASSKIQIKNPELNYGILPIAVASTFNPEKGRVNRLDILNASEQFENYFYAGFGTNGMPEISTVLNPSTENHLFEVYASYFGTDGGVPDALTEVKSNRANMSIMHEFESEKIVWNNGISYSMQGQNYYGIRPDYTPNEADLSLLNELNYQNNIALDIQANFTELPVSSARLSAESSFDSYQSIEYLLNLGADFEYLTESIALEAPIDFTYEDLRFETGKEYRYFDTAISPAFSWSSFGLFYLNIGAEIHLFNQLVNQETQFYIYPDMSLNYLLTESLSLGVNFSGQLNAHSYAEVFSINAFVAPDLDFRPSDTPYDINAQMNLELKGLSLRFKGGYRLTNDAMIFSKQNASSSETLSYDFSNSFGLLYDNVTTTYFKLEGALPLGNGLALDFMANYRYFQLENYAFYYNEPEFQSYLGLTYKWNKLQTNFQVFNASNRYDSIEGFGDVDPTEVEMDGFVDLNLSAKYELFEGGNIHLKMNNLLNNNYQEFTDYQVQGFQILGGFSYLFNF